MPLPDDSQQIPPVEPQALPPDESIETPATEATVIPEGDPAPEGTEELAGIMEEAGPPEAEAPPPTQPEVGDMQLTVPDAAEPTDTGAKVWTGEQWVEKPKPSAPPEPPVEPPTAEETEVNSWLNSNFFGDPINDGAGDPAEPDAPPGVHYTRRIAEYTPGVSELAAILQGVHEGVVLTPYNIGVMGSVASGSALGLDLQAGADLMGTVEMPNGWTHFLKKTTTFLTTFGMGRGMVGARAAAGPAARRAGLARRAAGFSRNWVAPGVYADMITWDPAEGNLHTMLLGVWQDTEALAGLRESVPGMGAYLEFMDSSRVVRDPVTGELYPGAYFESRALNALEGIELSVALEGIFGIIGGGIRGARGIGPEMGEVVGEVTRTGLAGEIELARAIPESVLPRFLESPLVQGDLKKVIANGIARGRMLQGLIDEGKTMEEAVRMVDTAIPRAQGAQRDFHIHAAMQEFNVDESTARAVFDMVDLVGAESEALFFPVRGGEAAIDTQSLRTLMQRVVNTLPNRVQEQAAYALGRAWARGKVSTKADAVEWLSQRARFTQDRPATAAGPGGPWLGKKELINNVIARAQFLRAKEAQLMVQGRRGTPFQFSPSSIRTRMDEQRLIDELLPMAHEGGVARYWYEDSSEWILQLTGEAGLPPAQRVESKRLATLLAITSQATGLESNWHATVQMWHANRAGQPFFTGRPDPIKRPNFGGKFQFGRFSGQSREAEAFLRDGTMPKGIKRNNFYLNLMKMIDPDVVQGVTIDRWAMRGLGYHGDNPTKRQYEWGEEFFGRLTEAYRDRYGVDDILPHQLQAMLWTSSRYMDNTVAPHMIDVHAGRVAADSVPAPMRYEHFGDVAERWRGMVTSEAIPHPSSGTLPGLEDMGLASRREYTRQLESIIADPTTGIDRLATLVSEQGGFLIHGTAEGEGLYQGIRNPGLQLEVSVPIQNRISDALEAAYGKREGGVRGAVKLFLEEEEAARAALAAGEPLPTRHMPTLIPEAAEDALRAYALARQYITRQEGVAWHRAFPVPAQKYANGIILDLSEMMTREQQDRLYGIIHREIGAKAADAIVIIPSSEGVRILNFGDYHPDGRKFLHDLKEWIDAAGITTRPDREGNWGTAFYGTGAGTGRIGYVEHDWARDPTGGRILGALDDMGRGDVVRFLHDTAPQVQALNERWAGEGAGAAGQFIDSAGRPIKSDPGWAPTRRLAQEIAVDGGTMEVRGLVQLTPDAAEAIVRGFQGADVETLVHEVLGHVVQNQILNREIPRHMRPGRLTDEAIEEVERAFGVLDGKWTVEQQELWAEAVVEFIRGGRLAEIPADSPLRPALEMVGAVLRDVYSDVRRSPLSDTMTTDMVRQVELLFTRDDLPIRVGGGEWMVKPATWGATKERVRALKKKGEDWTDTIMADMVAGVARDRNSRGELKPRGHAAVDRFDFQNREDVQRLLAATEQMMHELRVEGMAPPRGAALRALNHAMGRHDGQMFDTYDRLYQHFNTSNSGHAMDDIIQAGLQILEWQGRRVVDLSRRADRTKSMVDYAMLQREFLQYQIAIEQVGHLRADWGRAGQALQGRTSLPTVEELLDPARAGEFAELAGINNETGQELVNLVRNLDMTNPSDMRLGARAIVESNRTVGSRASNVFMEIYINGLLSAPSTWSGIAVASPVLVTAVEGLQHFIGGMVPRIVGGGGAPQMAEAVMNFQRWLRNLTMGAQYSLRAFTQEGGVFVTNRDLIDLPRSRRRAIAYGEGQPMQGGPVRDWMGERGVLQPGENDSSLLWWMINGTGRAVRAPGDAIATVDELFKQAHGRTALEAKIYGDEMNRMLTEAGLGEASTFRRGIAAAGMHRQVNERVAATMDTMIVDGRLRTREVLMQEALADPAIKAMDDDLDRAMAITEWINERWTTRHKELVDHAIDYSTRATFQGDVSSSMGKWLQAGLSNYPVMRVIIPFFRTPAKIFERFFGYSPTSLGMEMANRSWSLARGHGFTLSPDSAIGNLHRKTMADIARGGRSAAEARGRQAVGVALFYQAYEWAEGGLITGGGPEDPNARRVLMQTGWRPYSIRIGDTYVSYAKGDPWSMALGVMADTYEYLNASEGVGDDGDKVGLTMAVLYGLIGNMEDKSYLQGLDAVFKALRDPENFGQRWAIQQTTAFMPFSSAQRAGSRAGNPTLTETRTLLDSVRARTWILGQEGVPDRYSLLGEVMTLEGMGEPGRIGWMNTMNPFRLSYATDDPVYEVLAGIDFSMRLPSHTKDGVEMLRYVAAYSERVGEGAPVIVGTSIPDPDWVNSEGMQPYDWWMREIGRVTMSGGPGGGQIGLRTYLERLFDGVGSQGRNWARLEADTPANRAAKREMIGGVISAYRAAAYAHMLKEFPAFAAATAEVREQSKPEIAPLSAAPQGQNDLQSVLDTIGAA